MIVSFAKLVAPSLAVVAMLQGTVRPAAPTSEAATGDRIVGRPSAGIANSGSTPLLPPVRVLLHSRPVTSLDMQIDGPYRVHDARGGLLGEASRLTRGRVKALASGFRIGNKTYRGKTLEIVPRKEPTLWVGKHQYRGTLRLHHRSGPKLRAVNLVNLEDYVASVINGEMPADFPPAARRAQAIAARSYVLYQMKTFGRSSQYDVRGGTASQVYRGFQYRTKDNRRLAVENADSRRIVDQTSGLICTYRGRLFCTYYSAICGGRTTQGREIFSDAADPLTSVPCTWCRGSKYYRWESQLTRKHVEQKLRGHFRKEGHRFKSLDQFRVLPPTRLGLIPRVRVTTAGRPHDLSAYTFRLTAGPNQVRSPYFRATDQGQTLAFYGRGWGHGVGLCQWGARGQALAGRTTTQILQYYYRGAQLTAVR